jgi:hypothetical protein
VKEIWQERKGKGKERHGEEEEKRGEAGRWRETEIHTVDLGFRWYSSSYG